MYLWPTKGSTSRPLAASQSLAAQSWLPVAIQPPSPEKATELTPPLCPLRGGKSFPLTSPPPEKHHLPPPPFVPPGGSPSPPPPPPPPPPAPPPAGGGPAPSPREKRARAHPPPPWAGGVSIPRPPATSQTLAVRSSLPVTI